MPLKPLATNPPVEIRMENPRDRASIWTVNRAAFGQRDEADLVDQLRAQGYALLSLVAVREGAVVGHILFSRMQIRTPSDLVPAVALAPAAVRPEYQGKGIGSDLIRHGLAQLAERGEEIVIVAGHPDYYPRFGFSQAKAAALASPFPPEAFMAFELHTGALDGVTGTVLYPPPFGL